MVRNSVAAALLLALTACGGGSAPSEQPEKTVTPSPAPSPAPSPGASPAPSPADNQATEKAATTASLKQNMTLRAEMDHAAYEQALNTLLNQLSSQGGLCGGNAVTKTVDLAAKYAGQTLTYSSNFANEITTTKPFSKSDFAALFRELKASEIAYYKYPINCSSRSPEAYDDTILPIFDQLYTPVISSYGG